MTAKAFRQKGDSLLVQLGECKAALCDAGGRAPRAVLVGDVERLFRRAKRLPAEAASICPSVRCCRRSLPANATLMRPTRAH